MGNHVVNSVTKQIVSFSNSVTDCLYSGILIEGSKLATSNWQKRLMIYVADKNQNVVGLGIVGIDLTKLEWNKSEFKEQKDFLLKIVQTSRINKSYNKYVFQLKEEIGNRKLIEIENLISDLSVKDIVEDKFFFYSEPSEFANEQCEKHKVYMNNLEVDRKYRCLICSNDQSFTI